VFELKCLQEEVAPAVEVVAAAVEEVVAAGVHPAAATTGGIIFNFI